MIKHYITKYKEDGKKYAESWLQINLFGKCYCFSEKKIEIDSVDILSDQYTKITVLNKERK